MDDVTKTQPNYDGAGTTLPRPVNPELWPLWSALTTVVETVARDVQAHAHHLVSRSRLSPRAARRPGGALRAPVPESTEHLPAVGDAIAHLKHRAPWALMWPAAERLFGHFRSEGERLSNIAAELERHAALGPPTLAEAVPALGFLTLLAPIGWNAFVDLASTIEEPR